MTFTEEEKLKLRKLIKELDSIKGRHTELITVYVPKGYYIALIINQLSQEVSTAENIKSKTTRKNVIGSLEKAIGELKRIKQTPPNGLAVFSANVSSAEQPPDFKTWVIEPPEAINVKLYRCDQEFYLDPLKDLLEAKYVYGLVIVDKQDASIALLKGKSIKVIKHIKALIPGKMRAGGQSAPRFARVRLGLIKAYYKELADDVKNAFKDIKNLNGIIVGGPGPTKEEFLDIDDMKVMKEKIIAVKNIGYTGDYGLKELVNSSEDILEKEEVMVEKKKIREFFAHLQREDGLAVYGEKEVKKALELGAVEFLILSEKLDEKLIDELVEKTKQSNAEFMIASTETEEGDQIKEMGGIVAILRYKTE